MIVATKKGLYCEKGDFYIDPWRPVARAVITHAHSDHARIGSNSYLCAAPGVGILKHRLGENISVDAVEYGERKSINGVDVSLHPAGHILGSSQVRVEYQGEVWVVSGDYKIQADPTCDAFEPIQCHTFITESTFGLPVYSWPEDREVFESINNWWSKNKEAGKSSLLLCYSLGKAQRILKGIDPSIGPIFTHGAIEALNQVYRYSIGLPHTQHVPLTKQASNQYSGALILAPPAVLGSAWIRRFGTVSTAFASGWMRIRGMKRRYAVDRGFILSDHADWPALLSTIEATGASKVLVTHGYTDILVRYLRECGKDAHTMSTNFQGETEETVVEEQLRVEFAALSQDSAQQDDESATKLQHSNPDETQSIDEEGSEQLSLLLELNGESADTSDTVPDAEKDEEQE
ncbi:MAG: ligase-associated DNA damage response exonuclease [Candidatus Obscuribacterales bacterium]|nr:ligase-associated DNA damage response exonuclease [Candidatus Obscuribacterales bacterium]